MNGKFLLPRRSGIMRTVRTQRYAECHGKSECGYHSELRKSAGGQQEKTRPEDMASQAALNYCQTTGWTNSRVNFVESRPAGGYYVNVMKIDDSDNSYEENYVVTVENGKAIVTGTEQFGEFTPID